MNWSDVRIFLAIARTGSLGAAARQLEVSHPTVGRRLAVLEADSGQALFRRTAEGLVTTDLGDRLLGLAEEMEASALGIERRLAGDSQQLEGVLRISCADWFAGYVLSPVFARLLERHPLIVPEVLPGQRRFDLSRREADIAFRIVPFTEPDIVQRKLMVMDYGLYRARHDQSPLDKAGEGVRLILMDSAQSHYPDVHWIRQRLPRARAVFTSSSRSVQARMCAQGIGLAILPRPLGDQVEGLSRIEVEEPLPTRDIWMGFHQDMRRMDRLRALADLATQSLSAPDCVRSSNS